MSELKQQIMEALNFIRTKTKLEPKIGIILGTGLGGLAKEIKAETIIDYSDIPHFPISTVESHHGRLIFGNLSGKDVVAMQGRFHYYEGYTMKQITFPVRVMKFLGVKYLLISNAAGGLNPLFRKGDLMIITDHINLLGDNPLIGPNDDELGPRFPDMSEPYNKELIELAEQVALEEKIRVQKGVYVAMTGPSLETRAEYRFLRLIGADAVGMSTVPENIVANHMGMKVFGISVITDECFPDALQPLSLEDVIRVASEAEPKLTLLMKRLVEKINL
ncbi:MAG: purine-nucleoside phosphorylase [Candidatus Kryptonium sp.]|nr:purine-nucleoside phosphorylase [Candidatus Kryptonium sp.]MCX7761592.1 purine-nucleoside phosphorylase [Candidatus Kryptonium sp.]MDW8108500.1 purine-nucleoside phosphorylase [Candidatus Kryptonium sp.]